jgi:[acyl-carrier-protein] S-malonyltransferase
MRKKIVLLFSGQGAQQVGMGSDLAASEPGAAALLARADEVLGFPLSRVMAEGPLEELTRTSRCQPALYVHGLACWEVLRRRVREVEVVAAAGLSLGEFTAYAAAGAFSFEAGLELVYRRGLFMEEACELAPGTMAAMIGGDEAGVRALAESCGVDVANLNAPGQVVLSGSREGVAEVVARAREAGCRMGKELQVAGAYHSRLMAGAQAKLAAELTGVEIAMPRFPVVGNFLARPAGSPDEIRRTLEEQVTGSVRWAESMAYLLGAGYETFVELGPGGVLAGLMGRIRKGTPVLSAGDLPSIEATAAALAAA